MLAPKRLSHVATPADRPVRPQGFLQVFGGELVPFDGVALAIQQSRRVIVPVDFSERLVAIRAGLSRIPAVTDGPNQAGLGRLLNLRHAILRSVLAFRPTRARAQMELLVSYDGFQDRK